MPAGLPREFLDAVKQLPPPADSEDAAMAWLRLSMEAERQDPDGTEWLEWAQVAYRARPGILAYHRKDEIRMAGSETAVEWEGRAWLPSSRTWTLCLQEAAIGSAELGRLSGDWEALVRAEECLRRAGLPPKVLLPASDPASAASQGPDAAALDRLCHEWAAAPA